MAPGVVGRGARLAGMGGEGLRLKGLNFPFSQATINIILLNQDRIYHNNYSAPHI